ncbi:MAG TPA: NAD(P)-binding protein, partial [Ktedonobacteraceae bacterium]
MRVGIIGGGASGLITAWLLEGQHTVTLFEKQARLGGHAQTIQVEQEGQAIGIDAGFEFFSPAMFPLLTRLLKLSGVAVRQFPMTLTLYTPNQRKVSLIPPIRNRRVVWSAFAPRTLADMLQFLQVINRGLA